MRSPAEEPKHSAKRRQEFARIDSANQVWTAIQEKPGPKEIEMRSCNIGDKLAVQQVKEGPAKEAWIKEQTKFEIDRLKAILRDGLATDEEMSIAQSQIANYQEMAAMTVRSLPDWLQQMDLLADRGEDSHSMPVEHSVVADDDSSKDSDRSEVILA